MSPPLQGHDEIVWAVEVAGHRLFSASADKTIRVWDIDSRRCERVLEDHSRPVLSLACSDGKLFSGSYDYTIKVFAAASTLCSTGAALRQHLHSTITVFKRLCMQHNASSDPTAERASLLGPLLRDSVVSMSCVAGMCESNTCPVLLCSRKDP